MFQVLMEKTPLEMKAIVQTLRTNESKPITAHINDLTDGIDGEFADQIDGRDLLKI